MKKKRLVSAILALVMITVVLPCSAIAEAGSPLSALTVGETELTVSQDDLTTGWTGSTGWKYYAGKYLALVDQKEGKDITAQGDLQLAMAGLNHITDLESDADVHIFGTGILLLDDVGVEGNVTIDSQSAPAVFVLQEGTYQLQNPETAPAILDEAYTLPGGVNYLLPAGTSMKMVTTHFLEEGDHKYSAANLTVPAGVEMVVGGKLTIADNFCSAMYKVSAANLYVKGKLTIKAGASVAIGGDITVENGGTLQCEEYITNGYHDTIWDDGQGVWYPGMVRLQSGKEQTVMLDGATVLVGCDTKLSSVTTKGNSILGVTGPYKVDISSLKAETGKLQVKGFNFYQNGTYGSIPKGYSAVRLERVSGDITLEAGQFTFSDKSYPSVSLRDDVGLMNVVGGSVGTIGNTGYLFTAHDGLQEKGRVSVYVDTAFTMRSALGYCETDSAEAQNKFHREMNLLGEDIQSYLVEDETTLLHQAGYDTLKDLVSVADFDPQAYGQMYTVVFQVVSYPGSEAGKAVAPVMTYITSDNGQKVDLNEVAVVRCVAQMQSIGSTLGSTTSTTNTSATGSGNLGGSDGGSLSTSGASTSLQLTSYTVSASAGTGGRVSPGGKTRVPKGGSLRISITPDSEYEIDKVTVDGTSIGAETSYTFSNVSGNHTISASFKQKVTATPTPTPVPTPTPSPVPTPTPAPTSTPTPVPTVTPTPTPTAKPTVAQSHSITTTAGTGGTVSPAGTASYATGSSLTVKIKAKDGYVISKVTVDGKSVGAVSSYTFKDINADHTLKATFEDDGYDPEPTGYTIYASAGNGGSISPSGSISCTTGTSRTFTISADNGYELVDVKIDGVSMGVMKSYTFKSINDSHTINASFKKTSAEEIPTQTVAPQQGMTYAITVTSGNGGSVSPDGNVLASQGGQQVFTIVPESGYVIDDVQVDGASVGAVSHYVMQDITRNHTVTATFKKSETARFAILLGEGTGGTISCQENVSAIPGGTTVVVTITPQEGFAIADVLVDDVSVGAVPQYTFSGVNANHTVNAVFMEKTVEPVSRGGFPWVIVGGGLVILALAAVGVFALQYDRNRKH